MSSIFSSMTPTTWKRRHTTLVYLLLGTCLRHATASCSAGYFKPSNYASCRPCNPGTWSSNYNTLTSCKICPLDTYSGSMASSCTDCPTGRVTYAEGRGSILQCHCGIGYYWALQDHSHSNACAKCGPGSFNADSFNVIACENCDVGYIANAARTACPTACGSEETTDGNGGVCQCIYPTIRHTPPRDGCMKRVCAAGTYMSVSGCDWCDVTCQDCAAGTYGSSDWNQDVGCTPCAAGTYTTSTGSSACTPCAAGTYTTSTGSSACTSCPSNSQSSAGSQSITDCVCIGGYNHVA